MVDSRERIRAPSRDGREGFSSPRQVLRRLMLLCEGRQYREAAVIIGRLGPSLLRTVVSELPVDLLVEGLPHSAYLLESLFVRLNTVDPAPRPSISADFIIWHLIRLFSSPHECGLRQRCMKLIQSIAQWQPDLRNTIVERRKNLDQAVQGLGVHGLTADHTGTLISLHVALKNEIQNHIDTYKTAIHKLDELSIITVNQDPAQSSHQRLLAITYDDIQQRLIDNKSLLTILDKPSLKQLQTLIDNLAERVQNDKTVLQNVGQIKRLDPNSNVDKRPAAGLLMNFSRGCDTVVKLMGSSAPSSPSSESFSSDGYHSDSEGQVEDIGTSEIIHLYRDLYNRKRADTLETLNDLPQLKHVRNLKEKILFSIIVLSFRACHSLRERKLHEVHRVLGGSLESERDSTLSLDHAIRQHLNNTADVFPLADVEKQVANQVLSTLHEYPQLETCTSLLHFISASVRLSWKMVNKTTPCYLDNDFTSGFLRPEKHERHPLSDRRSDVIKSFLWPALFQQNKCVFKAVVLT